MGFEAFARRRALVTIGSLLVLAGCTPTPRPDPDGNPEGARALAVGSSRNDQLDCRLGDCSDWFRIELDKRGDLDVDVEAPQAVARNFTVSLASADGEILTRTTSGGSGKAEIGWATGRGVYLIEITTLDKQRQPLGYSVQARFHAEAPPPPPPPPPPAVVSAEVIEIEGGGDVQAVLVDRGEDAGLRPGLRGRLVDGDAVLGQVEVKDVYPEGSRLQLRGPLAAPITHTTRAEIEVPPGARPGATAPPGEEP